jgi:hypothetical protein
MARTLPLDCSDKEIRHLVLEWSELLAEENYAGALALLPPVTDDPRSLDQRLRDMASRI